MTYQAKRVSGFGETVFAEMTALAAQHQAINLGQGFPDFDGPDEVKEAAIKAIRDGINQYAVSTGAPALKEAISAHVQRFYDQQADPNTEIIVTSGATELLFAATMGLVDPADEAIIFEPFYDCYVPDVLMAGGVPRYVPLRPDENDEWAFDPDELAAAFNQDTKVIFVNTPHNPSGKVFTRDELIQIGELCNKWDVIAICDEVYEHIVFQGHQHIRMATLPGMAERTISVSSMGKSFSLTGWKVGWAVAAAPLRDAIQQAHQFITFDTSTPLQEAAAVALNLPDEYFQSLAADYQTKRDFLVSVLQDIGMQVMNPGGTYFVLADFSSMSDIENDVEFSKYLTTEVGVAAIPPTFFYSDQHKSLGQKLVRFAFCKTQATLDEAARRLSTLKT